MAEEAGMGVRSSEEEKGREGEPLDEMEEGEIAEDEAALDPAAGTRGVAGVVQPHLLEHQWTFWFGNSSAARSKQAEWGSNIRQIHTFSTVEDFWGLYNNIRNPSKLVAGTDFHCFKNKIVPMWEDPVCANGGAWTISSNYKGKSDTLWLYTLLALIGEQFDHGDEICGAVVNVRGKQERIAIWTKDASNEASQLSIGRQWKQLLDYTEPISFITHDDAQKNGRQAKNRFTV